MKSPLLLAIVANLFWGLSPLYYFLLGAISPVFLLCLQIVMTFLSLRLVAVSGEPARWRHEVLRYVPTATLIGANWLAYLLAVLDGKALDASYGYMIAPVLMMLLGQFIFKEAMTGRQRLGCLVCASAVALDLVVERRLPLAGLLIALPFSLYILTHKKIGTANPVRALRMETGILFPFALATLLVGPAGPASFDPGLRTIVLLALLGFVNAIPLILFVRASTTLTPLQMGGCQFISPVTSALLAVTVFANPIGLGKLLAFTGLAVGMALTVMPAKRCAVRRAG